MMGLSTQTAVVRARDRHRERYRNRAGKEGAKVGTESRRGGGEGTDKHPRPAGGGRDRQGGGKACRIRLGPTGQATDMVERRCGMGPHRIVERGRHPPHRMIFNMRRGVESVLPLNSMAPQHHPPPLPSTAEPRRKHRQQSSGAAMGSPGDEHAPKEGILGLTWATAPRGQYGPSNASAQRATA